MGIKKVKYRKKQKESNKRLVFKNSDSIVEFSQYFSNETVARLGMCQFRVNEGKFQDLKKIYKSGSTIFYIITTNQGITNVISVYMVNTYTTQAYVTLTGYY
jgi:hypothetical protein